MSMTMTWTTRAAYAAWSQRPAPAGWTGPWPPAIGTGPWPPGFPGPPPNTTNISNQAWSDGQWTYNPAFAAAGADAQWAPPQWTQQQQQQQSSYNPYKRAAKPAEPSYWETKLGNNGLGLMGMEKKKYMMLHSILSSGADESLLYRPEEETPVTPWVWKPKDLAEVSQKYMMLHSKLTSEADESLLYRPEEETPATPWVWKPKDLGDVSNDSSNSTKSKSSDHHSSLAPHSSSHDHSSLVGYYSPEPSSSRTSSRHSSVDVSGERAGFPSMGRPAAAAASTAAPSSSRYERNRYPSSSPPAQSNSDTDQNDRPSRHGRSSRYDPTGIGAYRSVAASSGSAATVASNTPPLSSRRASSRESRPTTERHHPKSGPSASLQSSGGDSRLTVLLDAIEGAADKDAYYSQEGVDQLSDVRTQMLPPPLYALCSRLTQLLASFNSSDPSYPRGVRHLRRMCREADLVPTSCILSKEVVRSSTEPSRSNFSDVWKGSLDGHAVALKVLRLHGDERDHVKKVCSDLLQHSSQTKSL
jgi:hypothetical protein